MDDFIRPRRPRLNVSPQKTPIRKVVTDALPAETLFSGPEGASLIAMEGMKKVARSAKTKVKRTVWLLRRINLHRPHGKKQWALTTVACLIFIGGCSATWWLLVGGNKNRTVANNSEVPYPAPPKTVASKLSGLQVDPKVNKRPVTAVMIENSVDARPQSGVKDAGVVFEAVAEGGITRFVALFQDTKPSYVGPIRSVRPYYIDWFLPFDASIAHVGGSPKALSDIRDLKVKDLDQFANGGSYSRITERFPPHNVYTSIDRLMSLEKQKGFTSANFTGFERKKEKPASTATARSIDLDISSELYGVHYDYSAKTNSYKRSEGGQPHTDEKSGLQLSPKVVIAVVMPRGIDNDGQHTDYTTTGSGKAFIFQDGTVTKGTWRKSSTRGQWSFKNSNSAVVSLNPGQTWITMVDSAGAVTYKK